MIITDNLCSMAADDGTAAHLSRRPLSTMLFTYRGMASLACGAAWVILTTGCSSLEYPEVTASNTSENVGSYDYIIGTGDMLNIYLWGYDDLQDTLPVRPDGQITTKLVEDLQAAGKTPSKLARDIERAYAEFVNNPVATVSVDGFFGDRGQQVKIIGSSAVPKSLPYTQGMTLLDLLIEAGGMSEFASGNRATLTRSFGDERKHFSLRIDDLLRKGDISANVDLRPGDVVLIPESWF